MTTLSQRKPEEYAGNVAGRARCRVRDTGRANWHSAISVQPSVSKKSGEPVRTIGLWRRANGSLGFVPKTQLSLLGLIGLVGATGCSKTASATSKEDSPTRQTVTLNTARIEARPVPVWLTLTGQLRGSRDADLAANANGKVVKTLVERGDSVKAGQPLAVLDTRAAALTAEEARASAESAAANAENARTNCERFRALAEQGAISQFEFEARSVQCRTSELAVSAARARAAVARQYVGDGVIRAPFAGSIAERYVDVGEYVRSDSRIVTLIDLSTLRLEVTLPENQIAAARVGSKLQFTVSGYPDKVFQGTLKYVSAQVRPTTRDVVAEAVVDTPDVILRPGMFASVKLSFGTQEGPVVPNSSLIERDGKFTAFVVVDKRLEERLVQVGERLGSERAIARGIAVGESLVLSPSRELKNGQRVR